MTIAELFVKIGLTGTDKAKEQLHGVAEGMGEIKTSSLAAQAAILGAIYGLEKLMSSASERGMALEQFANSTGMSTQALQKWQYAMAMTGVKAEETSSAFKTVQKTMLEMQLLGKAPAGLKFLTEVGFDMKNAKDTENVMLHLQKAALKYGNNPAFRNFVLGTFGLGDNFIQGLGRAKPDQAPGWAVSSNGQIKALADTDREMTKLHMKMARMMDGLTVKHGPQMIADITTLITAIDKLVDKLLTLSEKFGIFSMLSKGMTAGANFIGGNDVKGKKTEGILAHAAAWSPLVQALKLAAPAAELGIMKLGMKGMAVSDRLMGPVTHNQHNNVNVDIKTTGGDPHHIAKAVSAEVKRTLVSQPARQSFAQGATK